MDRSTTNRSYLEQICVFTFLVVLGTVGRLWIDLPNFTPVAALALFAGFYFRSAAVAIAVPVLVMLITDSFLGGYEPLLMVTVYSLLAMPIVFRSKIRSGVRPLNVVGYSLAASILFFIGSNFVVWAYWYGMRIDTLATCYLNALPFFRYTLTGDLVFASALFGGYALATRPLTKASPSLEVESAVQS